MKKLSIKKLRIGADTVRLLTSSGLAGIRGAAKTFNPDTQTNEECTTDHTSAAGCPPDTLNQCLTYVQCPATGASCNIC